MDPTHLHLILTHFPIVGTLIGILILAYGQFAKKKEVKKLALVLFIVMSLLTIPVFLSGHEAEETVEHLPGISEELIESHEELAEKAIWYMGLLGFVSLINLIVLVKKMSYSNILSFITLLVSIVTFSLFAGVGNEGGKIRHSEIRTQTSSKPTGLHLDSKEDKGDPD
ncbi:MAG: hypothetical protein ACPGKZ_05660 [Flavobacteriaceae bacterium]